MFHVTLCVRVDADVFFFFFLSDVMIQFVCILIHGLLNVSFILLYCPYIG